MAGHLAVACLWYARSWERPTCGVLGQVVGEAMVLSGSIWVSHPPRRGLVILHHGEKVKKHSTSLETERSTEQPCFSFKQLSATSVPSLPQILP